MEMVSDKGQIEARILALRIVHPLAENAFDQLDQIRRCKRESRAREEQLVRSLCADSHAGKSTTIRMYLETRIYPECIARGFFPPETPMEDVLASQKIVLFIEIPSNTAVKALFARVLEALDDPFPTSGHVVDMEYRADKLLRKHNVELLIFDEIGHLKIPKQSDAAATIHNHLKSFLRKGFPVVFVGLVEALPKIFSDKQIKRRHMNAIEYPALVYSNDKHKAIFRDFCVDLSISLKEKGILAEWSDFVGKDDEILVRLFQATLGLLGGVARLVESACNFAFDEKSPRVELHHLEKAADVLQGFADHNPFRGELKASPLLR